MAAVLCDLIHKVREDRSSHQVTTYLIFLGDYVDRGPDSSAVVELLLGFQASQIEGQICVFLRGNHEQMLLDFISNPVKNGASWLRNGGGATLASYGVHAPSRLSAKQLTYLRDEFVARLPREHLEFFNQLTSKFTLGDYFFCHAGVNARQALDDQTDATLLWTRKTPDEDAGPQEKIIVHGHQPVAAPLMARYHINVDTGAHVTGCLTAVKLIGATRKFISTEKQNILLDKS
jgi:serine/threonine protein phosphatase 1